MACSRVVGRARSSFLIGVWRVAIGMWRVAIGMWRVAIGMRFGRGSHDDQAGPVGLAGVLRIDRVGIRIPALPMGLVDGGRESCTFPAVRGLLGAFRCPRPDNLSRYFL